MDKELYMQLCFNFNKEPNEELHKLWDEELEVFDKDEVKRAVKNIMIKDKFMPNLNRILEELRDMPIKYITEEEKRLKMANMGIKPEWLDKDIQNEELDEETIKESEEFNQFIKDFRG